MLVDADELRPSPSAASRLRALEHRSPPPQQQQSHRQQQQRSGLAVEISPGATRRSSTGGGNSNERFFRSMRADFRLMEPRRATGESEQTTAAAGGGGGGGDIERASGKRAYKSSSDSSDDDAHVGAVSPPPAKKRRALNFFMGESQTAFATDKRATAAAPAPANPQPQPQPVCSSRTRICGQMYGRCELLFSERSVELVLWRRQGESEKRLWQGSLLYEHLERFWYVRTCLQLSARTVADAL